MLGVSRILVCHLARCCFWGVPFDNAIGRGERIRAGDYFALFHLLGSRFCTGSIHPFMQSEEMMSFQMAASLEMAF